MKSKSTYVKYSARHIEDRCVPDVTGITPPQTGHLISNGPNGKGQHPVDVVEATEMNTDALERLVARFDPAVFDVGRPRVRIRVEDGGPEPRDVVIEDGEARLEPARHSPDATLTADADTWNQISVDVRGGMEAFRRGRLKVRRDLHLGVGFLAATALPRSEGESEGRLRIRRVETTGGGLS